MLAVRTSVHPGLMVYVSFLSRMLINQLKYSRVLHEDLELAFCGGSLIINDAIYSSEPVEGGMSRVS